MKKIILTGIFLFWWNLPLIAQSMEQYWDSILYYRHTDPEKALIIGLEAINKSYKKGPSLLLLKINTYVGQLLSEQYVDGQAIKFFNESLKIFSALPVSEREEKNIKLPPWVLINIGNVYFRNQDYNSAEENYIKALENFKLYQEEVSKNFGLATTYDNLALIFLKRKNYNQAEEYFNMSSKLRQTSQKSEDILYAKLGFLMLYMDQNNSYAVDEIFKEIKSYYTTEIQLIPTQERPTSVLRRNYGYALTRYGVYQMKLKSYDKAIQYFQDALEILSKFIVELPSVQTYLAETYFLKNNFDKALELANRNLISISGNNYNQQKENNLKLVDSIYTLQKNRELLLRTKDSLISFYLEKEKNITNKEFSKLESYLLLTEKQGEINAARLRYNTYLFLLVLVCIALIFLFVSLRLNLNLQKANAKKATAEKKLIKMELMNKSLALINKTKFISQQSENLNYILQSTRKRENSNENIEAKIESLLNSFKLNDRFEKQFEEVYPGFFSKLIKHSNRLTHNDLRLCAFLRLNQTTKEIASISGVSLRTIESQKYRLKKKLNLPQDDNLINFVFSLDTD